MQTTGQPLDVVVMAAGQGTRMKSATPKVLHRIAGTPMLGHVLGTAAQLGARRTVVVTGHGADAVQAFARKVAPDAVCVLQQPQRGTGHAVQQAVPALAGDGVVAVLNGDVPLIAAATVQRLVNAAESGSLAILTIVLDDPTGYGRIVRDGAGAGAEGRAMAIVEHKDATDAQRAIRETYTGILAAPATLLKGWLARLTDDNAQREYYLTDVVAHAVADGVPVVAVQTTDAAEVAGVNSPAQLAALERTWQRRHADRLLDAGVRLADPARIDVRGTLHCAADVEIDVGCVFEGAVALGAGVRIGAHCVIANATLAAGVVVHPFSHIDGAEVGAGALIGPYARLRPGAVLGDAVHIGNFVEVKNSTLAAGAVVHALAHRGVAQVGQVVGLGAGAITANYDGANKHRTVIEADVHIGSNSVLVAPVTIGAGGTVGGGSTVSKSTPPGALTIVRAPQRSIAGWRRPAKKPG